MGKKNGFLKKAAIIGAVTGAASAAFGNYFIETYLSRKGIQKIIADSSLMPSEDSACFYESEEALAGIKFYREKPCEEIYLFNRYGVCLYADYYENESPSDVYVISCHGFTGIPSQNSIFTRRFYEMGYNVILPYLRAHGKSEHEYCTIGWLERLDIIDWINYIIEKNPCAKIILHGASMGAVTVMNATGEKLPANVICCLADCGFTSMWDQYTVQIREMTKIPADIILNIANTVAKRKLKFDFKDNSPLEQVKKSSTPTLFIHGDKDSTVPFWMNYPLYQNAECEKERLVVTGATHAASGYVYPEIYWEGITKFINKYI